MGNAAISEISGGETLGYTAPPMMVHGEHHILGEVEQEGAHALVAGINSNEFQALSDAYSDELRSGMSCRSSPARR